MKYIKFFFGCFKVFLNELRYPNSRAKSRRMAREFTKVAQRSGLGTKAELNRRG